MANDFRSGNSQLNDYLLKQDTVTVRVKLSGNATPADKESDTSAPGVAFIYAEGQTSAANAVEDIDSQVSETPVDATGKYSVLIDDPMCRELLKVEATAPGSDTIAITGQKLTSEGRVLIALDSDQDLSAANDSEVILEMHYLKKR
ncbi:MAG: hypothetical protein COB41_00345 [Proteobacteria bacterium]|nr:MAG: hypothetical protein COB41_00345 [Pseudomonadota bacterium]